MTRGRKPAPEPVRRETLTKVVARPIGIEGIDQRIADGGTRATYYRGDEHVATIIAQGPTCWWWTTMLGGQTSGSQREAEDGVRSWLLPSG